MKSNKKRGFTLVELLVVIAILAILATVSVVGYTSFIERATVSNDENVASQLNQFLIALKADSNSEYYQVKIDETNVREITRYILRESGLDELEPQSEKYGYHFYFDLVNKKYVVAADRDVTSSLATRMFAHAAGEKYFLGSCFTDGNYFLVDTKGDLADVINAIYTANSKSAVDEAIQAIDGIKDANIKSVVSAFVDDSVIVTDSMNYQVSGSTTPANIIFADGTAMVGTTTTNRQGEGDWSDASTSTTLSTTDKVVIPDSVEYFAENSLNIAENGEIVINKTPEEIGNMAQDVFANTTITITTTNGQFRCNVENAGASVDVIVSTTDSSVKFNLKYSNPMTSFSGTLSSSEENKVKDVTTDGKIWGGYIAWDVGSFTITPTKFVGENSAIPATQNGVKWEPSPESDSYIDIVGNTVTINYSAVSSLAEMPETLTIIGTPTDEGNKSETVTFVIETVYLKETTCTIEGRDAIVNPNSTFLYGGDGETSYELVKNVTPNKTVDGISLGYSISISNPNFVLNGSSLTLASGKETTTTGLQTIEVKVENYEYLNNTINLTMFNANSLTFKNNNSNLLFVGDDNAIQASDLFKLNEGHTIPAGAEIWIVSDLGDTSFGTLPEFKAMDHTDDGDIALANTWGTTSIQFKNGANDFTDNNQCEVVVMIVAPDHNGDYIRISDNHRLTIVAGKNVRSFSELASDVNNVLVSNISDVPANFTGFTLNSQKVLYGNEFVVDFRTYTDTKTGVEALININGATLNNVKVIGNVYLSSEFNFQKPTTSDYGASLVKATDGSNIVNCYLANTRSPLITTGTVTVSGSTIFGGNYANIDVRGGTLILTGNVTTVNQIIAGVTPDTVGLGIAVDIFAPADTKVDISGATLKQYNYVESSNASKLPNIYMNFTIDDVTVVVGTELIKVLNENDPNCVYTDVAGKRYFNTGIVFLNGVVMNVEKKNWKGQWEKSNADAIISAIGNVEIIDCQGGNVVQNGSTYGSKTVMVPKPANGPKEINIIITTYRIQIFAHTYFWVPVPDGANSGEKFNNNASDYYPSKVIPAN